jgi:hypothetical protein
VDCELVEVGPDGGWRGGEQVGDKAADRRAGTDLLRCDFLGGTQGLQRFLVFAPLAERPSGVYEQRCLPLGYVNWSRFTLRAWLMAAPASPRLTAILTR